MPLPDLHYLPQELEPFMSEEQISCHRDNHHVAILKALQSKPELEGYDGSEIGLETRILTTPANLTQRTLCAYYNHNLFFKSMCPIIRGNSTPPPLMSKKISEDFGSFTHLHLTFKKLSEEQSRVGSGFSWIVLNPQGRMEVIVTRDADCPIKYGCLPLLVCDIWEHAYILDFRHSIGSYIDNFFHVLNWTMANEVLNKAMAARNGSGNWSPSWSSIFLEGFKCCTVNDESGGVGLNVEGGGSGGNLKSIGNGGKLDV